MPFEKYLAKSRIIDLKSVDFDDALGEMLATVPDSILGTSSRKQILDGLVEREKGFSTYIGNCVSMPHIQVPSLSQRYVFVVGRCRQGLNFGGSEQYLDVRFVFLILAASAEASYLNVLSALARTFSDDETVAKIISARTMTLFRERVLEVFRGSEGLIEKVRKANRVFLTQADQIAKGTYCTAVVVLGDTFTSGISFEGFFKGLKLVLVNERSSSAASEGTGEFVNVRSFSNIRMGQLKSALFVALTKGIISPRDRVCCIGGLKGSDKIDTVVVFDVASEFAQFYIDNKSTLPEGVKPEVLERVIDIAMELSVEGREGKPVGSLFIIGRYGEIKPYIKQLVLNPFFGYDTDERNVLSPFMDETVKEFSLLDGAFVIDGSGTLESAGALVHTPDFNLKLPGGLGARHAAAYSISLAADCIAIVVSSSTGQVSLFRRGQMVPLSEPRS